MSDLEDYRRNYAEPRIGELTRQNIRMRKALEFYADPKNWNKVVAEADGETIYEIEELPPGETARKALEDE